VFSLRLLLQDSINNSVDRFFLLDIISSIETPLSFIMRSIALGLSFVSAAAAQIADGVSMVMISAMDSSSNPPTTATSGGYGYAAPSIQPAAPSSPSNFYDYMPYSSYRSGGYKTLECGYGYSKQSDGSCRPESWVSLNQDICTVH